MLHQENGYRRHKRWSERPTGAKVGLIAAGVILVPAFLALFAAITMWLWNWLMPAIFNLPTIGFWKAVGILLLSHILFKSGFRGRPGRSHRIRARIQERMAEEEPEVKAG